jgi:hypothetical protein
MESIKNLKVINLAVISERECPEIYFGHFFNFSCKIMSHKEGTMKEVARGRVIPHWSVWRYVNELNSFVKAYSEEWCQDSKGLFAFLGAYKMCMEFLRCYGINCSEQTINWYYPRVGVLDAKPDYDTWILRNEELIPKARYVPSFSFLSDVILSQQRKKKMKVLSIFDQCSEEHSNATTNTDTNTNTNTNTDTHTTDTSFKKKDISTAAEKRNTEEEECNTGEDDAYRQGKNKKQKCETTSLEQISPGLNSTPHLSRRTEVVQNTMGETSGSQNSWVNPKEITALKFNLVMRFRAELLGMLKLKLCYEAPYFQPLLTKEEMREHWITLQSEHFECKNQSLLALTIKTKDSLQHHPRCTLCGYPCEYSAGGDLVCCNEECNCVMEEKYEDSALEGYGEKEHRYVERRRTGNYSPSSYFLSILFSISPSRMEVTEKKLQAVRNWLIMYRYPLPKVRHPQVMRAMKALNICEYKAIHCYVYNINGYKPPALPHSLAQKLLRAFLVVDALYDSIRGRRKSRPPYRSLCRRMLETLGRHDLAYYYPEMTTPSSKIKFNILWKKIISFPQFSQELFRNDDESLTEEYK